MTFAITKQPLASAPQINSCGVKPVIRDLGEALAISRNASDNVGVTGLASPRDAGGGEVGEGTGHDGTSQALQNFS